jgi:hypothetical protein
MWATCKSNGVYWQCVPAPGLAAVKQGGEIPYPRVLARLPLIAPMQAAGGAELAGTRRRHAAHGPHALQQCHRCTCRLCRSRERQRWKICFPSVSQSPMSGHGVRLQSHLATSSRMAAGVQRHPHGVKQS